MADPYQKANKYLKLKKRPTCLAYSQNEHSCKWDTKHPENPERFNAIKRRLIELNLERKCIVKTHGVVLIGDEVIESVHSPILLEKLYEAVELDDIDREQFCSEFDSVYINKETVDDAKIAVQTVCTLAEAVARGEYANGMAIVRPPGHHATVEDFNGYCIHNNVAITAQILLKKRMAKKILIVDYDVHHGQGTQQIFYNRDDVLYFSIHRYEFGRFWPNLKEGNFDYIGNDKGKGYNVNVPLNETGCTDADYLAIVFHLLLPIAYEFQPDIILISAGYDACYGCPEGQMLVTPAFYGHLISLLSGLADGKIVAALEGGYFIESLQEGVAMTVRGLLGEPCRILDPIGEIKSSVIDTINNCKFHLRPYWKSLQSIHMFEYPKTNDKLPSFDINNSNEHVPNIFYDGKPDTAPFLTRDCYPKIDVLKETQLKSHMEELRKRYSKSLGKKFTGYVYDDSVLLHKPPPDSTAQELPQRCSTIANLLQESKLIPLLIEYPSQDVTFDFLTKTHDKQHLDKIIKKEQIPKTNDLYVNEYTKYAVFSSVGSLISLIDAIQNKDIMNGFAVIRPPGHHAKYKSNSGFCFVNNVVCAANYAKQKGYKRILIVDFDVHHGDGTQELTYNNEDIMYISIHRYDNATFFPKSSKADYVYTGSGKAAGCNINIPFNGAKMGNTEYLTTFLSVVLPAAYSFNPDIVFISAGFDASINDPLGKYNVYPEMFGQMVNLLRPLANGKVIMALEGGYHCPSLGYSFMMCVKALMGDQIPMPDFNYPCQKAAITAIDNVIKVHRKYWPILRVQKQIANICLSPETEDLVAELWADINCKKEAANDVDDETMKEIEKKIETIHSKENN